MTIKQTNDKPSIRRSLITGFAVVLAIVVLAYGFQVTKVNFQETRSEQRLTQLTRIIRALAHPEIFEYEQVETPVEAALYLDHPRTRPERSVYRTGPALQRPGNVHPGQGIQFYP
jgi:hypothetical protein